MDWHNNVVQGAALRGLLWCCGHCGANVGPYKVWQSEGQPFVAVCSVCRQPTIFARGSVVLLPHTKPGRGVQHVPASIATIYEEARAAIQAGAFTAAALLLRVIVLRIALDKEVVSGSASYFECIEKLADAGLLATYQQETVHGVRLLGNEANHEMKSVTEDEVLTALTFVEHVLEGVYEHMALRSKLPAKT